MSRLPLHIRIAQSFARLGERLGDAWYALVGPIERSFGRLGESMLGATDSFQGLESLVVRVVRFVCWPLIAVARLCGRLLPSGGGQLGRVFARIGAAFAAFIERFNLDGAVRTLVWLTWPLWRPIAAIGGFVGAWLATRRGRELALAAPALVITLPFAYAAVQGALLGRGAIAERYKIAVRDAVEAGDYAAADLYERKLAQMGVDTRRRDYVTALTMADAGRTAEAYRRMQRLAPVDTPGYEPARLWLLQRLLSGEITAEEDPTLEDEAARLRLAEGHLDRLAEARAEGVGLALMRAYVLARTDRARQAAETLAPYADASVPAASMRLRLLAQLREADAARKQARIVLELYEGQPAADRDPEVWALAAEIVRDSDAVEAALRTWLEAEPEAERPRRLLAQYRRELAERLLRDPTASPDLAAAALSDAARLGVEPAWINAQAAELQRRRRRDRYARAVWERLATDEDTPAELLEPLGSVAAGAGDAPGGRRLLERAVEADPESPVAWNNLAWTALQEPGADPDRALEAIERALELRPGDHRFRETRGQVMLALGRWDEAVDDLEYALNGLPDERGVHRSLATAYDALSRPRLAELHRSQADR